MSKYNSLKGQLSWGHKLAIYDAYGNEVGMVVQKVLTFLPKFQFVNLPFERGEILFPKVFFDFMDIRKLQDKAKTSYTLSTRRPRFGYE